MDNRNGGAASRKQALCWALALAPACAATAASLALDRVMSLAGLAMVYLLAVVAAACWLPRAQATLASLLCVTALNFLFVPPRRSLAVDGAESWWMLAVLLGLSLGIGALVERLRAKTRQTELALARAAQLHALAEALATGRGHQAMAADAAAWLAAALDCRCAVFLRGAAGEPLGRWSSPGDSVFDERAAAWAIDNGRPLGRGCLDWPDLPLWCAPFARHGASGAVQALLPGKAAPAGETLAHWQDLARQVGLAIERERAAAAARQAAAAADAEAARNTLLASLAHDLRTPLAGILGSASTLRSQADAMPAAQRDRLLASLEDEAQDMALMADNILQLARLSQPQSQLRKQWESLEDILGAAVTRMRRRWPGAAIQLRAPPGLPPLLAEAGLLAQAIANLVDNAARHGGAPPKIVLQAGKSRDGLFVAVRDHGAGLPAGDAALLFERWGSGAQRPAGGSGLGLAICRLAVEAHGGRVAARRCEPGTEFRIDLPAAEAPQERP